MSVASAFKKLKKETDKYKNTLVLDHYNVVVFLGVRDEEDDFYYEFQSFHSDPHKGKIYMSSCVGQMFPLIYRLKKEDYNYLADVWNLNSPVQIKKRK